MPTIVLRNLPADLVDRVRAYGHRRGLQRTEAIVHLVREGLARHEARQAGGTARHADTTAEERSATARAMNTARWARVKAIDD